MRTLNRTTSVRELLLQNNSKEGLQYSPKGYMVFTKFHLLNHILDRKVIMGGTEGNSWTY